MEAAGRWFLAAGATSRSGAKTPASSWVIRLPVHC